MAYGTSWQRPQAWTRIFGYGRTMSRSLDYIILQSILHNDSRSEEESRRGEKVLQAIVASGHQYAMDNPEEVTADILTGMLELKISVTLSWLPKKYLSDMHRIRTLSGVRLRK